MRNIAIVATKELRSLFNSAIAYIIMVVFLGLSGWFFANSLFLQNMASLRSVFELTPFLLLFFAPAITMRTISEERKVGTIELLLTKPVNDRDIIVGKFLASWCFLAIALAPTLIYLITVMFLGTIDPGPVIGGYLGLLLVGGGFLALGIIGSTLTENQVVAFIISFLVMFVLFIVDKVVPFLPGTLASLLQYLGIDYHFSNIARGVVDSRDLVYYFSLIGLSLLTATVLLERRK
jgi:ABC-2 type transport system permease protein